MLRSRTGEGRESICKPVIIFALGHVTPQSTPMEEAESDIKFPSLTSRLSSTPLSLTRTPPSIFDNVQCGSLLCDQADETSQRGLMYEMRAPNVTVI